MKHRDERVHRALIQLNDALYSWERATSIESVLILREQGGFVHRSVFGKPFVNGICDDISDSDLIDNIIG